MSSDRRIFVKKLVRGGSGFIFGGFAFSIFPANQSVTDPSTSASDISGKSVFPFLKYLKTFNIGEYIPKDQGGMFVQMELLKTEDDRLIVEKIRNGLLEEIYGSPINWNYNGNGELEKSVWLNRFYFLPSFARIFYLSGDISYLNEMIRIMAVWIEKNPLLPDSHTKNYNWRDMQVAWRAIHWLWCYNLTEKGLSNEQKRMILNSLKQHAEILLEGFGKQPLNEFNHQSHGALAMLYLGIMVPDLELAEELKRTALKILNHHLEKAFFSDGGNVEQMFGYYPFEVHIFRDAYLLCSQNNVEFPPLLLPVLEKMAKFLSAIAQPDGTVPIINDSFEMTSIPMLTILNEIFNNRIEVPSNSSRYFPETQIGIIRNCDENSQWYVLANPAKTIGAHAHAGRLAFTLWYNKQPLLLDSGCCNYDNPKLVSWYRTTRAHNTVMIDGRSDEATNSDRLWAPKRLTDNRIIEWAENDSYTFCRMVSPESEAVNSSVSWSRSLILIKSEFLVLHDRFESKDEHNYDLLFHFPPVPVSVDDNRKTIRINDKSSMFVIPAAPKMMDSLTISEGLVSIKGISTPSPMATFKFKGKGIVHSVVVFMPNIDQLFQIKIHQDITPDGIGVLIANGKTRETILLIRNPQSEALSAFGHQTRKMIEIF